MEATVLVTGQDGIIKERRLRSVAARYHRLHLAADDLYLAVLGEGLYPLDVALARYREVRNACDREPGGAHGSDQ